VCVIFILWFFGLSFVSVCTINYFTFYKGADDDGLLGDAERASLEGATQLLKQIIDILSPMSKYSASSELNLELCNSGSVSPQLYHAMSKLQEWLLMRNEGDFAIILTQENNTSSVIADFLRESHLKLKVACITGRLVRFITFIPFSYDLINGIPIM